MSSLRVVLFFRKRREAANFSIETSFQQMMESFPRDGDFTLASHTLSHISNGVVPRLRGALEARRNAGDVNHVTGDIHYVTLAMPGRRTILTIHDCGFLHRPGKPARSMLKWLWLDGPVHHCRYVTTVSEATRQDVIRLSGCEPDKVVVIPTIIAGAYTRIDRPFNHACPRILHIGLSNNKNFERHVAAIAGLRCELHVVGKLEQYHIELMKRHGIRYKSDYNIRLDDMRRAYAEADLVLFASTFEGFGMPIIEAQSVGRPVVTSQLSSMPEVAGRAACLVDPFSVESIRAGVERVIGDEVYRASLVQTGFENARRFDAGTVARQYEALYRLVADGTARRGAY